MKHYLCIKKAEYAYFRWEKSVFVSSRRQRMQRINKQTNKSTNPCFCNYIKICARLHYDTSASNRLVCHFYGSGWEK